MPSPEPRSERRKRAGRELPSLAQRALVALGVALLLLTVEARLGGSDVLSSLELETLDWRFRLRGPIPPGGETVLVMIDDATVARLGAWPAPREAIAAAVQVLAGAGTRVIALDLLFAEAQQAQVPAAVRPVLEAAKAALPGDDAALGDRIESLLAESGPDRALAAAIADAGRVITAYAFVPDPLQGNVAGLPSWIRATAYRVHTATGGGHAAPMPLAPRGVLAPLPSLGSAALSVAHVTLALEGDGSLRADLPVIAYEGDLYPSLPVEAARVFLGLGREQVVVEGAAAVRIGGLTLPLDQSRRHLVNHYGPQGTIPTYPLADLLDGRLDPGTFAGRIVIVAASAAGAGDRFVTPFTGRLPGGEFLATAIDNILHGRSLVRDETTRALDVLAILGLSLATALLAGRRSPLVSLLAVLGVLAAWWGLAQLAFVSARWWLAGLTPSAAAIGAGVAVEALRLAAERQRRRHLERQRANLARYFPPAVVERLAASDAPAKLDRTQEAVVMFVDVVGFTRIAEATSPAASMELLRGFHTQVERAVFAHGGMVDKFMGDGALACFGVPDPLPTAAADALRAALDLVAALAEPLPPEGRRLAVGIGIHQGTVLMGDIGGATQFQFTVIGDTVNVASRLQSLTREEKTALIVSDPVVAAARAHLEPALLARLEPLPERRLRGREGLIRVWRLAG